MDQLPPNAGGPLFPLLQATGCTGSLEILNEVQNAINCNCTGSTGSLCDLVNAAAIINQVPLSCMTNLLTGEFSQCGAIISDAQRQAAFNAFTDITGFKPVDLNQAFSIITEDEKKVLAFTAFYIFFPLGLIILIGIWILAIVGTFTWPLALFLSIFLFIILYLLSIAYRNQAEHSLNSRNTQLRTIVSESQTNFQNSVALFPQALYAIACAITGNGWRCNPTVLSQSSCASCVGKEMINNDVDITALIENQIDGYNIK